MAKVQVSVKDVTVTASFADLKLNKLELTPPPCWRAPQRVAVTSEVSQSARREKVWGKKQAPEPFFSSVLL